MQVAPIAAFAAVFVLLSAQPVVCQAAQRPTLVVVRVTAVGEDGHRLLSVKEGTEHWQPALDKFLRQLNRYDG